MTCLLNHVMITKIQTGRSLDIHEGLLFVPAIIHSANGTKQTNHIHTKKKKKKKKRVEALDRGQKDAIRTPLGMFWFVTVIKVCDQQEKKE